MPAWFSTKGLLRHGALCTVSFGSRILQAGRPPTAASPVSPASSFLQVCHAPLL